MCLWICTLLQNFMALSLSVFELCWLKKKKIMNKTPIIAPYIYDARYHDIPYILSTTVLSDFNAHCTFKLVPGLERGFFF